MAAPTGLIVGWPSTAASIPAGWTRVAAMDSRYPRGATTATGTGGSNTHSHTGTAHTHTASHNHTIGMQDTSPPNVTVQFDSTGAFSDLNATHHHLSGTGAAITYSTYSAASASAGGGSSDSDSSEPSNFRVIWIQSDGSTDIPVLAIGWYPFGLAAPTDHTKCRGSGGTPDLRNVFLRGAATGSDGGTSSVVASHLHVVSHSHAYLHNHAGPSGTSSGLTPAPPGGPIGTTAGPPIQSVAINNHHHTYALTTSPAASTPLASDENSGSTTVDPPWQKIDHIQKTGVSASIPSSYIAIWNGSAGSIPALWDACDGTDATPDLNGNVFLKGANSNAEAGTTGGSSTHVHSYTHAHDFASHSHNGIIQSTGTTFSTDGVQLKSGAGVTSPVAMDDHSHAFNVNSEVNTTPSASSSSVTSLASASNLPAYYDVIFIMRSVEVIVDAENLAVNVTETELIDVVAVESDSYAINVTEVTAVANISAAITSPTPSQVISSQPLIITWSVAGGTQYSYRVIVSTSPTIDPDDPSVIYDSGTQVTASHSDSVPTGTLETGETFYVTVYVIDTLGLEAWATPVEFETDYSPSVDVTGVRAIQIGSMCAQNDPLPHVRIQWAAVVAGSGETFVRYNVKRRELSTSTYTRIKRIGVRTTTHYEDYTGIPGTIYEYAITWTASTSSGNLTSANQNPAAEGMVDFEWSFLHEQKDPSYSVRLESEIANYGWDDDQKFSIAWGRSKPTAFFGEKFARVIAITSLEQMRKDPRRWRALETIMGRQLTSGSVLVLRVGIDKTRTFVHGSASTGPTNQAQWSAKYSLREVHFEEDV